MTETTQTPPSGRGRVRGKKPVAPSSPAGVVLPPTRGRRRPWLIAGGVAVAIVGGLASYTAVQAATDSTTVLVTSSSVTRGEQITAEDITTIQISGGQDTPAYTAGQSTDVIGSIALVDLPQGSLLTTTNTGDGLALQPGESIVGVALTASQMPSYPLAAGDLVRIVDTPIAQGDPPAATPSTFKATVFTTRYDEAGAQWIVDLVVPKTMAADIAARSATGRIALVLDAAE